MPETKGPLEIVDISNTDQETAEALFHAASTQGFLVIEGHDFTEEEVRNLFDISKSFFQQPLQEKLKFLQKEGDNAGYTKLGAEKLDDKDATKNSGDPKESFYFNRLNLVTGMPNQDLPPVLQKEVDTIADTIKRLHILVRKILELLAMGLKIDPAEGGAKWFVDRNRPDHETGCAMRFLYYPSYKSADAQEKVRAGAHTDYGSVTLLFQHEEIQSKGLEIFSPVTKKWEAASFIPASDHYKKKGMAPPIVVNIGDELSYWTNGVLKSTIHRVKFPKEFEEQEGKDRYSIVFFSQAETDVKLSPVPSEMVKKITGRGASHELAKHGKVITSGEYLKSRLAATYGKY